MTDNPCINCGCPLHPGITCEHALDKLTIDSLRASLATAQAERDEAVARAEKSEECLLESPERIAYPDIIKERDEAVRMLREIRRAQGPLACVPELDAFLARIGSGKS